MKTCKRNHEYEMVGKGCPVCKKQNSAKYRQENTERVRQYKAKYRQVNKEDIKQYNDRYYQENTKHIKKKYAQYYQENTGRVRQYMAEYQKQRKLNDPLFKLTCNLRTLIGTSLKNNGYTKKSRTFQLLGVDFETVQKHLIQSAKDNYGIHYSPDENYEIDHKIPNNSAKTEEEVIKLCHYSNLQYLTKEDNMSKFDKLDWTMKDSITLKRLMFVAT